MNDSQSASAGWTFWIDRGGTFTDIIGQTSGSDLITQKLPSVSTNYPDAAIEGMRRILGVAPKDAFPLHRVLAIKLGTTVATNTLLQRTGAKTLFVTTSGFADALLIGDQTRPELFARVIERPNPLYTGVLEAIERLDCAGVPITHLDEAALREGLSQAHKDGFESVAIAFLHADLNAAHELRAQALALATGFDYVTISSEASPLPRFLARAETAVVDAYLTPGLKRYVQSLSQTAYGIDLHFMTSSGGLVRAEAFRGRDAVLSGPAGGAIAIATLAEKTNTHAVLGFDMGGTSTDVCRFAGELERRDQLRISGVTLRTPMLDVHTIAAGGGSVLSFDGLRARVGPMSAGAEPGPAAYGRGGPATVTDANLVLGRLNPGAFPAKFGPNEDSPLDIGASRAGLDALAKAMGSPDAETAAEGFLAVAVEQMAGAIARISTMRGFDPRDHALAAFGGAAGQVACQVADALGIREILCPPYASLLSAWGIGQAKMRSLRQAGLGVALGTQGLAKAIQLGDQLSTLAKRDLADQGADPGATRLNLRLCYEDADVALPVVLADLATMRIDFESAHLRLFGFIEPGGRVLIAAVEAEVAAAGSTPSLNTGHAPNPAPGRTIDGPHLIVQPDTQIWIAPGWAAVENPDGLVRLSRTTAHTVARIDANKPDPVTLELFNRRFMAVAQTMGTALELTARSVNIKERLDFSCALFDADGGLVANAPHMPVHLGSMGASVRAVRERHPHLQSGQAFALNNPYVGGTHLPDITVVMPVFAVGGSGPSFFVAARGHHADVGGVQPGSMPPFSTSVDQEGILLDALLIMADGLFLDRDVHQALIAGRWPARQPERNLADLKAQIAACQAGATLVKSMFETFGSDVVTRYMEFVQANAEACVRRAISKLTAGTAHVPIDGGGEIVVRISLDPVRGEAILDFRGSSAQLRSNFNAPSSIVDAAALYVFRCLVDDDIPLNAGCLAPLKILLDEGSMLSPHWPAAVVAGNVETSQHIVDALFEALGVMAHSQGSMNNFTFGDDTAQYYETICGGIGATSQAAGASAIHSHMTNSRMTDPEILERRFPVRLERFSIRRGSGGSGRHTGGDGAVRRLRFLAPMQMALLSSRRLNRPRGMAGGGDGAPGTQVLIAADGKVTMLGACFSSSVQAGDAIEIQTPGGGGFGDSQKKDLC